MTTTTETYESRKEEAIRLLETTSLTLKEIEARTGIKSGTVGAWSKLHRPKHISDQNKRRGSMKGAATTRRIMEEKARNRTVNVVLPNVGDFKEDDEKMKELVMSVDTETVTSNDPFEFNFSIGLSERNLTKEEVLSKLHNALNILDRMPVSKVSFELNIRNGEK
ncbi:hypothetical protein Z3_70 [Bacillus phage Z3]|nr:hypothetical protein Z3_70 [Bacillus phage Z3]